MNKRKFIPRLLVSPFILGVLIVSYSIGCLKHWIRFVRYGGEWITYVKDDPKRLEDIFNEMKKSN